MPMLYYILILKVNFLVSGKTPGLNSESVTINFNFADKIMIISSIILFHLLPILMNNSFYYKKFLNFIKKNIIEKTFVTFSNFINLKTNYKISLNKKIPVSAGLGGGSADAAVVLQGLNLLNKKKIKQKDLFKIAMKIGFDVPACLYNKNVFFSGHGQILSKAPKIPQFSILLINPRKELSTKKIFSLYKSKKSKKISNLKYKNFFSWILKQNNDLQKYSEKFVPEIKEMLIFLNSSKNCFFSKMTGSGPTVFGLFRKKIDAKKLNLLLKKKHPKWWSGVYSIKT